MNPLQDILSSIDPTTARIFSANPPVQRLASGSPKPSTAQRPAKPTNGTSEASGAPGLKRKASGAVDVTQNKILRKDAPTPLQTNGATRASSALAGSRSNSTTPTTSMPYRGTAGLGASKAVNPTPQLNKPSPTGTGQAVTAKATASSSRSTTPRPTGATPSATAAPTKKTGGYLAMLQKAKEKEATKPATLPIKHEPAKIMTKKDREQARLAAKVASKGKKPTTGAPARTADTKMENAKEKRKPAELGYQGTARPTKKPTEVGYKGTARPAATAVSTARAGAAPTVTKKKTKPAQDRYSGYANWSDLDEMDDDEDEDDYASDASSDMEGGMWDLEKEESEALKAAKQEDAKALAEENQLKREKEERKRKLAAMSKAAAAKRKY